jgi:hypothetical protein
MSHSGSLKVVAALTVAAIVTVVFAAPAPAQSIGLRVEIPFEFQVGSTVLPPGTYEVWRTSDALSISDRKGHSAFVMTDGIQRARRQIEGSELVFNVYGSRYFLGEVRWSGYPIARLLQKSKVETELAKATQPTSTVNVAAK